MANLTSSRSTLTALPTTTSRYYDIHWHKQPFTCVYPRYEGHVERPSRLDEMLDIASGISDGFPFLRVDFYQPDGDTLLIGELTFYHQNGFQSFSPSEWNQRLGELIDLPIPTSASK